MSEVVGEEDEGGKRGSTASRGKRKGTDVPYRMKKDKPLGEVEQLEFLHLISQGCTALYACHQLGRTMRSLAKTMEKNQRFRREYGEIQQLMNQRVESALYKAALKGNVAAQTLWLRHRAPKSWQKQGQDDNEFEEMTDEELFRLAKREGIDLSEEFAEGIGLPGGEQKSQRISKSTGDPGGS
ncbi:MAG: hypothetical protein KDA36_07380 [Planctomycetaceae bacterium]|nr:hypothetical protein [Planctomycetaceae bacterium]